MTFAYLGWTYVPLAVAVRASFTRQPLSNGAPAGWSLRHYRDVLGDPVTFLLLRRSFGLAVLTVLIAVPLGTAAALALNHARGGSIRSLLPVIVLAIAIPQTLLAANLFILSVGIGTNVGMSAQLIGHVTVALPFVVLIVLVGAQGIHPEHEESAMDLGAGPLEAIRRVVLPMLTPALLGAAAVAFVLSYDNFVMSGWLCIETARCDTVPMSLFGRGGVANPGANSYALATLALGGSLVVIGVIAWLWNRARRRSRVPPVSLSRGVPG